MSLWKREEVQEVSWEVRKSNKSYSMTVLSDMKTLSTPALALLQALGLILYVGLFVLVGRSAVSHFVSIPFPELLFPMVFLLAFVSSALICSLIVFGLPIKMGLEGDWKGVMKIPLMTAMWLVSIGVVLLMTLVIYNTYVIAPVIIQEI